MVATDVASRGIGMIFARLFFNPVSPSCVSVQMLFSRYSAGLAAISCFYSGVCWFSPMRTLSRGAAI